MIKGKNNIVCLLKGHRVFFVGGWSKATKTNKCCYRCNLFEMTPYYRAYMLVRAAEG